MNIWCTVGRTVWEGFKVESLLEEECPSGWDLMFQKPRPLTMSLSLCLTYQLGHNLSVTMPAPRLSDHYCVPCHDGHGLSQIKCFIFLRCLHNVCHGNKKKTGHYFYHLFIYLFHLLNIFIHLIR